MPARVALSNCPIREHTADGAYVGRCDFTVRDGVCCRHGMLVDYPTLDDREVDPPQRRFSPDDHRS
jgi:hypothetical protein